MAHDRLSMTFAALADPTRRAILTRLTRGEATVTELAKPFKISLPAISKHLQVLERASLIERGRDKQWRPRRLQAGPLKEVVQWLEQYRSFWDIKIGEIDMQRITPHLWFDKEAREAAEFYTSVFPKSKIKHITTLHDTPSGTVDVVTVELLGHEFMLISAGPLFKFNEAISFIVYCDTQEEIDYYWEKLSAVPEAEQCGWLKDKFGLSWQIVPTAMGEMMKDKDDKRLARVTQAFLKMKKLDIAALKRAYEGNE